MRQYRHVAKLSDPVCKIKDVLPEGMMLSDIAVKLEVPSSTINNYPQGVIPSLKMALHVARAIGCRVEDIWALPSEDETLPT